MFDNVYCGMVMCDFAFLIREIDHLTLAPRGCLWGNKAASFGSGFCVSVRAICA